MVNLSDIHKFRSDFESGELNETTIDKDPGVQFSLWLDQASKALVPEFQAMMLSTVSPQGRPSSRIVYLREFENHQLWFYTNYHSRKGHDLQYNPQVSLAFFWPQLERQVRIEGVAEKATPAKSDAYYDDRPYESRIGAWSSEQSGPLHSRADLEERVDRFQKQFTPDTIKRPEYWGGYVVTAGYYEFWQGRKNRLHDRIAYTRHTDKWAIQRLAP